ncbi:MAG TPA: transporter substrate-binding domain-containing protein [Gammaproteobacteria bacterium]|nr:transporter substrate-binding domain-containing protein [Gammaproteobacteria bacterium]
MPIRHLTTLAVLLLLTGLLAGCERYPQDPHHTLDNVLQRGVLYVGAVENPPWVIITPDKKLSGIEVELIRDFAKELGVTIQWYPGSAQNNLFALKEYKRDIVVGGFKTTNPWKKHVAFSIPYYNEQHAMAVTSGENAFLMQLEAFLLNNVEKTAIKRRLRQTSAKVGGK